MNYRDYQYQTNKKIGSNIKKYRKIKGLTQVKLSELLGKTPLTIQRYESGKITVPIDVLDQIANELDTTYLELIGHDLEEEAEREAEYALNAAIEQLEDLDFSVDSDEHADTYNEISIISPQGYTIKNIDRNKLIAAFDYKTNRLNFRRIFDNDEYDEYIIGKNGVSDFIRYLEKKNYSIDISETANGYYGYVRLLIDDDKYKIDYDEFVELEKELLKYFKKMLLSGHECDDGEWDLED